MSIIKRKNKSLIPSKDDLSMLDNSVGELSQQTSQLLSHFGESKNKDKTSKKISSADNAAKKNGGRKSFDIISSASVRRTVKKQIKPMKRAESEVKELLPEHAGKSFNELPYEEIKSDQVIEAKIINDSDSELSDSQKESSTSDVPAAFIVARPSGSLMFRESDVASEKPTNIVESSIENQEPEDPVVEPMVAKSKVEIKPDDAVENVANGDSTGSETDIENDQSETAAEDKSDQKQSESNDDKIELNEEPASGELYVNSLVKQTDKKGYVAPEGQQKPTVFDTNEYHPELHDWSKLENKAGVRGYILALLLVIAGALAYVILSGIEIPFISKLF